jgi:hypothetical protein
MATSEPDESARRNRVAVYVLAGLVVFGVILALLAFRSRPPQMGPDEDVFNTVDALYTAVRNQDEKRLGECATRLKAYREAGKLPADAANALDGIIAKARSGSWESAAERLYDFMLAQKREGAASHAPHKPQQPKKGAK